MMLRRRTTPWLRATAITAAAAVGLWPLYWMFVTSVTPTADLLKYPPSLLPTHVDVSSFGRLFSGDSQFLGWIVNSIVVTAVSLVIALAISILAGYSLSRFKSRAGSITGFLLLLTKMIPATLFLVPFYVIFRGLGLVDSRVSLVIAYVVFEVPFATWMLKGYFDSLPRELEEAAQIDGCSELGAFVRVTLPLAAPGIAATVLASALLAWSDYDFARGLITSQSKWPVTVGIQSYFGEHVVHWNDVMASSLITVLPVVALFIFMGRYMVAGLTAGAVK